MITRDLLRSLRNDLPMTVTIRHLGRKAPYFKTVEGRFRFQCPHCGETLATVNPRNNLAHCFGCQKNINNIDLLIKVGYGFTEAVALLQKWLFLYNTEIAGRKLASNRTIPIEKCDKSACPEQTEGAKPIGSILRQEFGNRGPWSH